MEFFVVLTAVLAVTIGVFVSRGVGLVSLVVPAISSNFTRVNAAVGILGVRASWRFPLLPVSRLDLTDDRVFKFSTNEAATCTQALEMARRHPRN